MKINDDRIRELAFSLHTAKGFIERQRVINMAREKYGENYPSALRRAREMRESQPNLFRTG